MADFQGKIYEIFIPRNGDILETIESFVLKKGWQEAIIINAIGSVLDLSFANPVCDELPLRIGLTPCHGASEIVAFTGEIMVKERMDIELKTVYPNTESPLFIHIHASCARAGGQVMGGGLRKGRAFRSLRVFITPEDEK